jgi:hypothetical protein
MEADGKTAEEISASIAAVLDLAEEVEVDVNDDVQGMFLKPSRLFKIDTSKDETCLLGNRWLCTGGAALINGQAGLGKSSFVMQAVVSFARGLPLFGLTPKRPLKSLVVQAENDLGDLAEQYQGVIHGLGLESEADKLDAMIDVVPESRCSGAAAIAFFDAILEKAKPDLIWIDPLLAYLGGDVNKQEVCGAFLRQGITPLAQKHGCGVIIVHHTGKPPKEEIGTRNSTYSGIGSSELSNWARAVIELRHIEPGLAEVIFAKRGRRAGLVDENGLPATKYTIQHSQRGICWEPATRIPAARAKAIADGAALDTQIVERIGPQPQTATECHAIIMGLTGAGKTKGWEIWDRVKLDPRIVFQFGRYFAPATPRSDSTAAE